MGSIRILRHLAAAALAVGAVVLLGWVGLRTGPEPSLLPFHLLVVATASWWLGRSAGMLVAIAAGVAWLLPDLPRLAFSPWAVLAWEVFGRLILLSTLALLVAEVRRDRQRLVDSNARLAELLTREADLARTDALTRLPNGRAFVEQLEHEIARCRRSGQPLAVGYLDLDDFKRVNDLYGHAAGDELLRRVADTLRASLRGGDVPARIGGDEFAVLFTRTDLEAAQRIGQRLVERVRELGAAWPQARVGASVGIVSVPSPPADPQKVLALADGAMYRAKHAGKGSVQVARLHADLRLVGAERRWSSSDAGAGPPA